MRENRVHDLIMQKTQMNKGNLDVFFGGNAVPPQLSDALAKSCIELLNS